MNPQAINLQMSRPNEEKLVTNFEDESVDQLLEKLAKKGKKVKIIGDGDDSNTNQQDD